MPRKPQQFTNLADLEDAEDDERIRAALIIRGTQIADRLSITPTALHDFTEAVINDDGTRDSSGVCRLCRHDHEPVYRAAAKVADEMDRMLGPSRNTITAWANALRLALMYRHDCPCDLAQVGAASRV